MVTNQDNYLKGTSLLFRVLYRLRILRDVQRHGRISLWELLKYIVKELSTRLLFMYSYYDFFNPLNERHIRPFIWKQIGANVGKNVHIGHQVWMDIGNPKRIHVGDGVVISQGVTILCHKRDVKTYSKGQKATELPFKYEDVIIENGCQIGAHSTILPGVKIGEGTIVGSCSLVTKDIPCWSIAVGSPAKVVRTLE